MIPTAPLRRAWSAVLAGLLCSSAAAALDGKWTPAQVLELDPAWLAAQGLALPPSQLWEAGRGTGLLSAAISIGGCSGAFVSDSGLILTNHHCLFGLLQEHSTPDRDLIRDGFVARDHAAELRSATLRVQVPKRFTDVTATVLAAVPDGADPLARRAAIDAASDALVADCEGQADRRCVVAVFDEGVQYSLIESIELRDVRLVYAPPRAVGEFGGEIDNWSWPRHSGDVALARAWAGADGRPADRDDANRPYRPEFHFPIATDGIADGDVVMVLGYPGLTYRALLAEEMEERRQRFFVRREELFGAWIALLRNSTANDPAGAIAVAANLKSILNRHKNAQGQIAGIDRGRMLERQRERDDAVARFAAELPAHHAALTARDVLREVLAERAAGWERDFLLRLIPLGIEAQPGGIPPLPKGLYFGATLAQHATQRALPDDARAAGFTDAELPRLRERLRSEQGSYHGPADQALLRALIERALALPADQRIAAIDDRFLGMGGAQIAESVAAMYAATRLLDPADRLSMMEDDSATLAKRDDPLLQLGIAWNADRHALQQREQGWAARTALARPAWRHAVAAHGGRPLAADANGTLRVSFGHVQGYSPRDGLLARPFTTLPGLLAKYTGQAPFDLPQALRDAAIGPDSRWIDPRLGALPLNFLADADTSGGNSGSPVLDGRGRLVGVNFDRVWENVAGDFGFNPALARNISVDVRYLLWLLETVEHADHLLRELGVGESAER